MKRNKTQYFPVSVIVPMRNSETTVTKTLDSILRQDYPTVEVIVIDNASTDDSVRIVESYRRKIKQTPIRLVRRQVNRGVGASYNLGAKLARTEYLVFMHSDSILPSRQEMTHLTKPLRDDTAIVASYSAITLPKKIWLRYPFWEKCLLARAVGKSRPGLNGKFDCLRRDTFLKIGGFDEVNYGHDIFIGGEDADLGLRLASAGKIVASKAKVIHLHYLDKDYSLSDWIANRKLLARSYGRFLRIQWRHLSGGAILFAVKPLLVLLSLILPIPINLFLLVLFAVVSMTRMYRTPSTLSDPRIILLPFISAFLIYYETFWMVESFLFLRRK